MTDAHEATGPDLALLTCLRCEFLGRRSLLCREVESCATVPQAHPLGAMLILAWLAMLAGFVAAVTS